MANPKVQMNTSRGRITIELWSELSPISVENFIQYVKDGFFEGTIFHRVIPGFMIQGGGFSPEMKPKATRAPIKNEASASARNVRGAVAMARTNVVDSATAQFFINLVDNDFLDHKDDTPRGFGYAAFGQVIEGMDVVDMIAKTPTGSIGGHENVPVEAVVIQGVTAPED